jgi:hypothetical protein
MKQWLFLLTPVFIVCSCKKSSDYINNPDINPDLHNRATGASANEILASSKYTSLKIEVQYMTGFNPDPAALNHLQNTLAAIINKPGGITVVTKEIPTVSNQSLSAGDVYTIEKNNRTVFTSGNELALYILYTNGNYTDPNVLGLAYKNTSVVLFGKKINDNSGGLGQASRTKLVATVAEHEMGHLMGLVDLGSPMQTPHKDAAHGNHCNNNNCLMYYASETSDILGFLITGNIPAFDSYCLADLHANGGK